MFLEVVYDYIRTGLGKKFPVIFVSTDTASEEVKKELVKNKIFYSKNMRFVDCYSQQAGNNLTNTSDTIRVSGPLALNEISIALAQIETELFNISEGHCIVFDSLSTLLMYSNAQMIGRFLQVLIAKIRQAGGSVVFTLEEGMHDPKDMVTIEHLMNGIIHVKHDKEKVLLKAEGISGFEDWKEF